MSLIRRLVSGLKGWAISLAFFSSRNFSRFYSFNASFTRFRSKESNFFLSDLFADLEVDLILSREDLRIFRAYKSISFIKSIYFYLYFSASFFDFPKIFGSKLIADALTLDFEKWFNFFDYLLLAYIVLKWEWTTWFSLSLK